MTEYDRTVAAYDQSAARLSAFFDGRGARTDDIEKTLELAGNPTNAHVVEIGCGTGRDAAVLVSRVGWYEGFDPSEGMLAIARETAPDASFVQADALNYDYPTDLDAVFAFGSLLHVDRSVMKTVLQDKVAPSLRQGGVAFLSLRASPEYARVVQPDEYGERTYYHYNPTLIKELGGAAFEAPFEAYQEFEDNITWFTIALRKL